MIMYAMYCLRVQIYSLSSNHQLYASSKNSEKSPCTVAMPKIVATSHLLRDCLSQSLLSELVPSPDCEVHGRHKHSVACASRQACLMQHIYLRYIMTHRSSSVGGASTRTLPGTCCSWLSKPFLLGVACATHQASSPRAAELFVDCRPASSQKSLSASTCTHWPV